MQLAVNKLRPLLLAFLLLPALAQAQIAFRAASSANNDGLTIQQRGVGTVASGTGGTVTPGLPTRVAGDLLLLVIEVEDDNALTINNWTLLTEAFTGTTHHAAVYWRIATNTAADTASIQHAPGGRNLLIARITAFSNVNTANPFDGTPSIGASATNTVATGGITTTNDCSLRVATVHITDDNTITNNPTSAGWFQSFYNTSTTGNDGGVGLWFINSAGAGAQPSVSIGYSANDPSHAMQFALRPEGLVLNVPAGTQAGDVMVATIATRPANSNPTNIAAKTICEPAGWTLVRDTINNNGGGTGGGGLRLTTYVRVATASEPASYSWYAQLNNPSTSPATVFVSGAGGIASYSGVDNVAPVNVEAGNFTASSLNHTGNSITTTVTNTMLVASHAYLSSDTWVNNQPASMTERVDRASPIAPPGNDVGITMRLSDEPRPGAGATGNRTAVGTGLAAADQGIAHMMALRPAPPTNPGRFNAFDSGTVAGAIAGNLQTRVAGVALSFDIVAIDPALTGILTTFTGTVLVELLDASDNTGAMNATTNCRASWGTVIATVSPNPAFIAGDNGRRTVSVTVPNVYREVRVRVTYPAAGPATAAGCSTDNFAIRPASFSVAASDSDWSTAGTARTLNNVGAAGGAVHKAGQPFTVRVTPSPASATNYNGDPTVSGGAVACSLPAPCSNGALTLGTFTNPIANNGLRESTTATYNEVGAFNVTLIDQTFASVDSDDTPATCAGYHICQSAAPLAVGRFVPDHFTFSVPGGTPAPQFRTFDTAACARSFTYIGQPFGYATAPTASVEARAAPSVGGNITTNYRGALFKLAAADLIQTYSNTPVKPMTPALLAASLSAIGNGTATFTANAGDKVAFDRNPASASVPFSANIALSWEAEDDAENGANQGIITTPTPYQFSSIAFDAGAEFRYGRLRLANANGSQLVAMPLLMEAQYANAAGIFVTNNADNCTSIGNNNVQMTFSGNLAACETAITGAPATLSGGRRTLVLPAPGTGNDGAATLTVNLGAAASGTTCIAAGGGTVPAAGANRLYLQGNWTGSAFDDNPTARATFGTFRGAGEVIFIRENF